jgi:transcriptional regulator with XRE-family HTH domain
MKAARYAVSTGGATKVGKSFEPAQHFLLRYSKSMPVSPAVKVEALSKDFRSQRRLADALGVSPAQVSRWRHGKGIDEDNADRLDLLELTISMLRRMYEPETVEDWLFGLNPHLRNRRPIDVIRLGAVEDILAAIRQERAGSYA